MRLTSPKIVLGIAVLIVVALAGGFVWLGAPGAPPLQQDVHKEIPVSRFADPVPGSQNMPSMPAAGGVAAAPVPIPSSRPMPVSPQSAPVPMSQPAPATH